MKSYQVWVKNYSKNDTLDYDYDIEKNDDKSTIRYSQSRDWSESFRGDICANIEDDGNGVKINIGKKTIKLDYAELIELKCLLMFDNEAYIEIKETNTIKIIK